jgi:hypothetical protein
MGAGTFITIALARKLISHMQCHLLHAFLFVFQISPVVSDWSLPPSALNEGESGKVNFLIQLHEMRHTM